MRVDQGAVRRLGVRSIGRGTGVGAVCALLLACTSHDGAADATSSAQGVARTHASNPDADAVRTRGRDALTTLRDLHAVGPAAAGGAVGSTLPGSHAAGWHRVALSVALPTRATAPLRLTSPRDADAWIEVRDLDAADVASVPLGGEPFPSGSASGRSIAFVEAHPATDVVHLARNGGDAEELRLLRDATAPRVARWEIALGPAIATVRLRAGRIEAVGANGYVHVTSDPIASIDGHGLRAPMKVTLSPRTTGRSGAPAYLVEATLDASVTALPIAIDPAWQAIASMNVPRTRHSAALLGDGRLFVDGGTEPGGGTWTSSEIYNPSLNTWTLQTASDDLYVDSWIHSLADGTILSFGGTTRSGRIFTGSSTDPAGGTVTSLPETSVEGDLLIGYTGMSSAVFADGSALVVAGSDSTGAYLPYSYIFEHATQTFHRAGAPHVSRAFAAAAITLADGERVLLTGGYTNSTGVGALSSAEIFDRSTETWTLLSSSLAAPRYRHWQAILPSGDVFIAGGNPDSCPVLERFDVATSTFSSFAPSPPAWNQAAGALVDGKLVLVGHACTPPDGLGTDDDGASTAFDFSTNTWSLLGDLPVVPDAATIDPGTTTTYANIGPSATSLRGNAVLVAGGSLESNDTGVLSQAALYTFATSAPLGGSCVVTTDCASGTCVEGVCCSTACTGTCQSCVVPGSYGTCTNVEQGADPHGNCAEGDYCSAGACVAIPDGGIAWSDAGVGDAGDASGPPDGSADTFEASTDAPDASEAGAVDSTVDAPLDAPLDAPSDAVTEAAVDVGGDATSDVAVDVASDALSSADANVDAGPPSSDAAPSGVTGGSFKTCAKASDCPSGHCVDGVCCDTACDAPCHSCALPSGPGVCSVEPYGVDLRDDCSGGSSCVSTCGGDGSCAPVRAGAECAPATCVTGSTGVGAAYCAANGATCASSAVTTFDCAPFACAAAFGACIDHCAGTSDCADGFVCLTDQGTCTRVASSGSGGCGIGRAPAGAGSSGVGAWAGMLAAGVLARRGARRRRR